MMRFAYLIEPPFNFLSPGGAVTGCDVELARAALNLVGIRDFELVETEFARLLPGLGEDRWEMTTGLFATQERRKTAAFTRPIWALSDGLLVRKGNPLGLTGYQSIALGENCALAVVRDQIQHRAAIAARVPADRILVFETYSEASRAVLDGRAQAYASVARAHIGFLESAAHPELEAVTVSVREAQPALGAFAFRQSDDALREAVDAALQSYLGSLEHRAMMKEFGFSNDEFDLTGTGVGGSATSDAPTTS
jgi:polar amino acid transport system substrate-binding protein